MKEIICELRKDITIMKTMNIMSIIKTAKLRNLNPLSCIREIYQGKSLFA